LGHIWTRWLARFKSLAFSFFIKIHYTAKLMYGICCVAQVLIGCVAVAMVEKYLLHRESISMQQYICFAFSLSKLIILLICLNKKRPFSDSPFTL
jgi:hypothetical protein